MWICIVHLMTPKSRGTVRLKSKDPYDDPLIDPNYYAHTDDVKDVVDGK